MVDFSFGFTEGSFLLLNGQKHMRSVAEDLVSNKLKRTKRIYQKLWRPVLVKITYFYCLSFIHSDSQLELFLSVVELNLLSFIRAKLAKP